MRKWILWIIVAYIIASIMTGCNSSANLIGNSILGGGSGEGEINIDYRKEMREFVKGISSYAKNFNQNFIVITQNGQELLTENGEPSGEIVFDYVNSIDGIGREELFYGYEGDDIPTSDSIRNWMIQFLDIAKNNGKKVLVIDYCKTPSYVDNSYNENAMKGYISFAADSRELNNIPSYPPSPYNVNSDDIILLSQVKNFLYLINPSSFSTKEDFLNALKNTDYDLLIIDSFYNGEQLTEMDVNSLKVKKNGGKRLVIAYMSIGEAEDYRYYWKNEWKRNPPPWLAEENPKWPGNYKVRYWYKEWQNIIYGNDSSYTKRILDSGFDGVYLDIIDAFEYFESQRQ
jgi:cysteinyl-tRNA synthetase